MRCYRHISFRSALLISAVVFAAFAAVAQAQTYNLRVLHRFAGPPDDGDVANTSVRFDSAGNLYGATQNGGAFDGGVIYKIAKDGTESILHSFEPPDDRGDAVIPNSIVIDSSTGDIYGTTIYGPDGNRCGAGCGQIYKLAADGTFTVLHTFGSDPDGSYPSPLIRDPQGNLYGTTETGGFYGEGTVFEYTADGTYEVLHSFEESSGYHPRGSVIRDRSGNLYGVTYLGAGPTYCGTIYRLAPNGAFNILHKLGRDPVGDDGCYPTSLAADQTGNFYGTTDSTVFKFTSGGIFTTLHTFAFNAHFISGINPVLPVNGTLYGSAYGLQGAPDGVLFKIAPDGTYAELYRLGQGTGVDTQGRLTLKSGRLYGTTIYGDGGTSLNGTVFSLGVAAE